jgi:hypothetical protein
MTTTKLVQHYLITNIGNVTITGGIPDVYGSTDVHLHASAIVLTRDDRPARQAPCRIRLFGPDASWPVTELAATSLDHKISPIPFPVPGVDVIQVSYTLRVDGRWNLKLRTESEDGAPPEVTAYPDGTPIGDVWQDLRAKVAKHWSGPNMPTLEWLPADYVRQLRKTVKES